MKLFTRLRMPGTTMGLRRNMARTLMSATRSADIVEFGDGETGARAGDAHAGAGKLAVHGVGKRQYVGLGRRIGRIHRRWLKRADG